MHVRFLCGSGNIKITVDQSADNFQITAADVIRYIAGIYAINLLQLAERNALGHIFTDMIVEIDNTPRDMYVLFQPFAMYVGGMILNWAALECTDIKRAYAAFR